MRATIETSALPLLFISSWDRRDLASCRTLIAKGLGLSL